MKIKKYFISIGLVIGIVIFVNLLSDEFFIRFDFTENNQYSLSKATKSILKNLDEPVTIKAYFSKNLPPNISFTRRDFKDMLIEYANYSKGKLIYDIVDPNSGDDVEKEAMQDGVQPVLINVREKDQMKQQKAYLGAVIKMGDSKEVIPFIQPNSPMEYLLSSAIKKLSITDKPVIGYLQGNGEPSLDKLSQVQSQLDVMYKVQPIQLNDTTTIPNEIKTLALVMPTDSFSMGELKILDNFLDNGNNLFIAIKRVNSNLQTLQGTALNTLLESWLSQKGIYVKPSYVIDTHCGSVNVQQQHGNFNYMTQIQFPYLPIITKFADQPIVKGLESVTLPFVSSIRFIGDTSVSYSPLAFTSEKSGELPTPLMFNAQKQWGINDFTQKNLVVAAAFNGKIGGSSQPCKMVVIGNGDFAVNQNQQQKIQDDNVSLFINSIDWLSDDTGLIELRTKGITSRPIDDVEDRNKTILKFLNFFLPIILIVIFGIFRIQHNKNIRIKRMEENYG